MSIRKLIIVSDLHVGSTLGLMPPGFVTLEGNQVSQNKIQKWLWNAWKDLWEDWVPWVTDGHSFAVIINGDLVEGLHHRTTQVISPDFNDHIRAAEQALRPLVTSGPSKIFITEGTESHTRNSETSIGVMVGSEVDPNTERMAFPRLDLRIAGTNCTFFHHVTTTSRSYLEGSALSITLGNERMESARAGLPVPQVLGMAHRHRHGMFNDGQGLAFTTGAFQALTRFGMKVVPSAIPAPSCVALDWSEKDDGSLPMVYEKVYAADKSQRISVSV